MIDKLERGKIIGMDRQRKIWGLNNIKELTKLLCERCCWDIRNGYGCANFDCKQGLNRSSGQPMGID